MFMQFKRKFTCNANIALILYFITATCFFSCQIEFNMYFKTFWFVFSLVFSSISSTYVHEKGKCLRSF